LGVITCQNPPVNQLSYALRVGILNGINESQKSGCKATVIYGGGKTFPAGADIKEFSNGMAFKTPITDVIKGIESSKIPVVAAIHGTALGGGLEIALACHYRIGTSRCRVGVPEVQIGLLPGAGGTQRLPRVCGPMIAAEMCSSGQHLKANRAKEINILDEIIHIESNHKLSMEVLIIRQAGIQYALKIYNKPLLPRIVSKRKCPVMDEFFYTQISKMVKAKAKGFKAPLMNIEAVKQAGLAKTFEDGMKKERELFVKLATSTQAKCLQHFFFAQRMINKIPGIDMKIANKIKKVGIIGCGTMGGGIVMCFIQANIPVIVLEIKQQYLDKGLSVVKKNWMNQVKRGRLSVKKVDQYMSMIKGTTNYNDLSDCDIVIEAVFENLKIKEQVFKKLDDVCKPSCILASNTSYIPIEKIAAVTRRPNQVIGTHFFAPANKMLLLENVKHNKCDNKTIATVQNMAKIIKKKGVLVGTCDGFVGNRMFRMEGIEALRLTMEGIKPKRIDDLLIKFGYPMGIFQVLDLSGLDIGYRSREDKGYFKEGFKKPKYYVETPDILVRDYNRLGLKVGKGIYDYPKGRKPVESKLVNELFNKEMKLKGKINRNDQISDDEIIARCLYPMINEGFKILEEGIAIRPSDIDVVLVFGYGFPPYRGGIMKYADTIGIKKIRDTLNKFYNENNECDYFIPSNLLNIVADKNISLQKYWKKQNKKSKL